VRLRLTEFQLSFRGKNAEPELGTGPGKLEYQKKWRPRTSKSVIGIATAYTVRVVMVVA
jgi:hypothetical protein